MSQPTYEDAMAESRAQYEKEVEKFLEGPPMTFEEWLEEQR